MNKRPFFISLIMLILLCGKQKGYAQKIEVIRFSELHQHIENADNILIINFWATWCKPCVEEIPHFETIAQEFRQKKVKVLFVSLDFKAEQSRVEKFILAKKMLSKVVLLNEPDYDSWIDKIDKSWTGSIPATLFVNKSKKIFLLKEQTFDYQELYQQLKSIF